MRPPRRLFTTQLKDLDKRFTAALEDIAAVEQEMETTSRFMAHLQGHLASNKYREDPEFRKKHQTLMQRLMQWIDDDRAALEGAMRNALTIAKEYLKYPNPQAEFEMCMYTAEGVTSAWINPSRSRIRSVVSWQFVK